MHPLCLGAVRPPHPPVSEDKLGRLIWAYQQRLPVTPIVVLDFHHGLYALCGSHRYAAMRKVFGAEEHIQNDELESYIIVLDGEELFREVYAVDIDVARDLDTFAQGCVFDYTGFCTDLYPYLDRHTQKALLDQTYR